MTPSLRAIRQIRWALLPLAALWLGAAQAFVVTISPGTRAVYLRIGNGVFTGTYRGGGTPGSGGTLNKVSVTVPAAALGNGTDQPMTSDATQTTSHYDGYTFCNVPDEVYIGGFYRRPTTTGSASLTVSSPAGLSNGNGDSIAFSQIAWASSGNGDTGTQPIPAGSFNGGVQSLASFPANSWRESCHRFRYANDAVVAAGTYTGRVVYTLSAP
ncbi:hypothetical protein [Lysobacter firmicutimachus]|uniref:Uncharacterized protein n=1 Tax=Lysobacter firmicutimachus TaxID=1792846 RepID=A0ABU8D0I2_9GAMM